MDYLQTIRDYQELKRVIAPKMLRQWRGALSLERAAKQLGCAKTYIWKIEQGKELINDDLLIKLIGATKHEV